MAKNDYHVIAYRILAYLYACLKQGEKPNLEYLKYDTDDFPIGKDYWYYILTQLFKEGYIDGAVFVPVLGETIKAVRITDKIMITPSGIEYLQNNSAMKKALDFLKTLKEIVPGI